MAFSLAALPTAEAATLRLDRGFGEDGIARLPVRLGPDWDYGGAGRPVRQPDGKVLVVGWLSTVVSSRVWLVRFKRTGQPDRAFGRGGRVRLGRWGFGPRSVLPQPDGRILLVGSAGQMPGYPRPFPNQIGLMRLLPDGSPDRSFGTNGLVAWNSPWRPDTNSMAIGPAVVVQQADGRLLVGGPVSEGRVVRDLRARLAPGGKIASLLVA